jgi:hypothetical protein
VRGRVAVLRDIRTVEDPGEERDRRVVDLELLDE